MVDSPNEKLVSRNELTEAIGNTRSAFITVLLFSLVINLLMLTAPIYMLQVYNRVLTSGSVETLVLLTLMAAIALLAMSVLETLRTSVTVRIGCWLNDRVSPVFLDCSVRARLKGDTSGAQAFQDIGQIQSFIATQGMTAFLDSPWVPIFVFVIWILHPMLGVLALVSAVLLLLLSIANDLVTKKPMVEASAAQFEALQLAETTIRNADAVQSMALLPALTGRWRQFNSASVEAIRRAGEAGGIIMAITKFVRMFVQVAILGLGAWLVLQNQLTPGGMIAASILLGRALAPVELAIGAWKNFMTARISYKRLQHQMELYPREIKRTLMPKPVGHLTVNDLSYVIPGTSDMILSQISLDVEPGEAMAVIGPSGAGKSTLCRMLVGLSEPSFGDVRLDGSDLRHWDPQQLGRHIGYLPQDVELFHGTVAENIARMGYANDDDVLRAANTADVHSMIQRLPDGYNTLLGRGGVQLSGGQRQRIGLARAVFGNPRVVVLDEPNANLDQSGEAALGSALEALKAAGCALIIVGHRPSTLSCADKIMVVTDGRIAMFGPSEEIMQALASGSNPNASPVQRYDPSKSPVRSEGKLKKNGAVA